MSSDGVAVSTFSGGKFTTTATDTGKQAGRGQLCRQRCHRADHRHVGYPWDAGELQLPDGLDQAAELHEHRRPEFLADPPR